MNKVGKAPENITLGQVKPAPIKEMIDACIEWIRTSARPDGGFPGDNNQPSSCAWVTVGLTLACWTAGIEYRELFMRRALLWTISQHDIEGGIPSKLKGGKAITDATAQTALACSLAARSTGDPAFLVHHERCIRWLVNRRSDNGGWRWSNVDVEESVASTAFAILALSSNESKDVELCREVEDSLEDAVRWLKEIQKEDGGWGYKKNDITRPATTALVTSALCEVGAECSRKKMIRLLLSKMESDGSWRDTFERAGGTQLTRSGTAYSTRALAICGWALDTPEFRLVFKAITRNFDRCRFRFQDYDTFSWPTRDHLLALTAIGTRQNLPGCRTFCDLKSDSTPRGTDSADVLPPPRSTSSERRVLLLDLKEQTAIANGAKIKFKRRYDLRFCALVALARVKPDPACGKKFELFYDEHLKAWASLMEGTKKEPTRDAARQHHHYLLKLLIGANSTAASRRFFEPHFAEDVSNRYWLENRDQVTIEGL